MAVAALNALFDEIQDFLTSTPTLEQIIEFKPSEALEERLHYLLDQNGQGRISNEERQELDEFLRMNHFMNMLKIRSRKKLAGL